ncbi:MAG: M56 family metallopeptidase, partial [Streptosporangiaceae bacterium]
MFAALWAIGFAAVLGRALVGLARVAWIARGARRLDTTELVRWARETGVRRRVALLENERPSLPLTFGILRPVILIPAEARAWEQERRRMVLLHELVHVKRLDWLTQLLAQLACALYWFHPLAWMAAARLREERERACDDCVLRLGTNGAVYAGHLLELARSLQPAAPWPMEVGMAQPSGLEKRVAALLDPRRDRRPANRRTAAAVMVAALVAAGLLAPGLAPAQDSGITLFGVVSDPSHARVPGAVVIATNADEHGKKEIAVTDPVGAYKFQGIAAGRYTLDVRTAGFKIFEKPGIALEPGASVEEDVTLDVGAVSETVE